MPERIYMNRIAGEERIHIEIAANEIADILDDLVPQPDAFDATKRLHAVLAKAANDLNLTCRVTDTAPVTGVTRASDGPTDTGTEAEAEAHESTNGPQADAQAAPRRGSTASTITDAELDALYARNLAYARAGDRYRNAWRSARRRARCTSVELLTLQAVLDLVRRRMDHAVGLAARAALERDDAKRAQSQAARVRENADFHLGQQMARRQTAERQRDEVLRIVTDWCIEANDIGGIDAGDLAGRLKEAGHPLPDTDEPRPPCST